MTKTRSALAFAISTGVLGVVLGMISWGFADLAGSVPMVGVEAGAAGGGLVGVLLGVIMGCRQDKVSKVGGVVVSAIIFWLLFGALGAGVGWLAGVLPLSSGFAWTVGGAAMAVVGALAGLMFCD